MKIKIIFSTVFLLFFSTTYSQSDQSHNLELIEKVKQFCNGELKFDISKNFYTKWANSEEPNYFLYLSKKDEIAHLYNETIPYKSFRHNYDSAEIAKQKYNKLGYSTLIYQTYGTAAAKLSKHLLSYSRESISFIVFHEATHQIIRKNSSLPYDLNESLCDIVGNYGTIKLFETDETLSKIKAVAFVQQMEIITSEINNILINDLVDYSSLESCLTNLENGDYAFLKERYCYEVNNAYLLRNRNYTLYYFKLKELLFLYDNLSDFLDFVIHLSYNGVEFYVQLEQEILRLKSK